MDFPSRDYELYPGSEKEALKGDFESFRLAAAKLGVGVTTNSGGSKFSPKLLLINIDAKTQNQRGFVSLGQLTDEYLHAWNQVGKRGRFLDAAAAKEHQRLGRIAETAGTKRMVTAENAVFHKLEALNFVCSGQHVPGFMWRVPFEAVRSFAYSWATSF